MPFWPVKNRNIRLLCLIWSKFPSWPQLIRMFRFVSDVWPPKETIPVWCGSLSVQELNMHKRDANCQIYGQWLSVRPIPEVIYSYMLKATDRAARLWLDKQTQPQDVLSQCTVLACFLLMYEGWKSQKLNKKHRCHKNACEMKRKSSFWL